MKLKCKTQLKKLFSIFTIISFLMQPSVLVFAQTTAEVDNSNGKGAQVDQAANGTTVVNIRPTDQNGLSHNQWSNLQVGTGGIIFNNSNGIVNTQLGGLINGNPYGGGATRILNEVTGNLPTNINGYMEVAGKKADLIIANQNGIVGSNFGFINTNRAVLTTGTPQFGANGQLNSFQVTGGSIAIEGQGMNANGATKTQLISQAVKINAQAHAQQLEIITGNNQVDYNTNQITVLSQPTGVSLDVSAIGGMYANRIYLVGTGKGMGVNSQGSISATSGDLVITQEGKVVLKGDTFANNNISITADSLDQTGTLYSKNSISAGITNSINNTGTIKADATINLQAKDIENSDQIGANNIYLQAENINNTKNIVANNNLILDTQNTLNNTGLINATTSILTANTINNTGTGKIYADNMAIEADTLNNIAQMGLAPVIAARQNLNIGAKTINNKENAIILSQNDMAIGGSLNSNNQVIGSADVINNNSATIQSGNNLYINADEINNTNEHFSLHQVEVYRSDWIEEYQGSGQSNRYTLDGTDVYTFYDESEHLMVNGVRFESWLKYRYQNVILQDQILTTDPAKIIAKHAMTINANTVTNDKSQIVAGGNITANIETLNNIEGQGKTVYKQEGTVTSNWRDHRSGIDTTGRRTAAYAPAPQEEQLIVNAGDFAQNTSPNLNSEDGQTNTTINLPNSSLFDTAKDPNSNYLIETDPNFTDPSKWMGSDYFLSQVTFDPDKVIKRLGDAYYEQQLIQEQILNITGNYVLESNDSNQQYKILMDNALAIAQNQELVVGVALTQDQINKLDKNIVWMVEKDVVLPSGEVIKALVPQVYIANKNKTGAGSAVLSGQNIDLNLAKDILNTGTIQAKENINIKANDINNIGGKIIAESQIDLTAKNNINIESTTSTQQNAQGHTTNINAQGTIYVKGKEIANLEPQTDPEQEQKKTTTGTININAGNDLNINAGTIINDATEGQTNLTAENNVNIGTVQTSNNNNIVWDGSNKRSDQSTTDEGSFISTSSDLNIKAGNDINAKAAYIESEQDITLSAGNDINIEAGRYTSSVVEDHKHTGKSGGGNKQTVITHDELDENLTIGSTINGKNVKMNAGNDVNIVSSEVVADEAIQIKAQNDITITGDKDYVESVNTYDKKSKGLLSKKSTNIQDEQKYDQVVSSTISGGTVELESGNDTNILASNVVADNDININAGGDINIQSLEQTSDSYYNKEEKKSGFMTSGIGFSIGKEQKKDKYTNQSTEQVGSMVGSLEGSVNINAGSDVNITASDVMAKKDISIEGNSVNIVSADHVYNYTELHEYKKSGLTVSLGGYTIGVLDSVYQPLKRSSEVSDGRLKGINYIKTGIAIEKAITTEAIFNKDMPKSDYGLGGKGSFAVDISFGSSKSKTEISGNTVISQGSTINAEGDVTIVAREKDINIKGSDIKGENVTLQAQENVNIEASANTNLHEENSSSKSSSIGISIDFTGGLSGGFNASKSKGEVKQNGTVWQESTVTANDTLTIQTGKDLNISGSQVIGDTVNVDVIGDLNIETLQDNDYYNEKNTSSSIGINISGITGVPSVSGSASKQTIDSEYESNQEQSGIFAGEGGFDITVGGNTDLKGGVISSKADEDKNSLTTGTISFENIENKSEYNAEQTSVGFDTSPVNSNNTAGGYAGDKIGGTIGNNYITQADSSDSKTGTTQSAVSDGTITITDQENQKQDIEDLSRDTQNANGKVDNIFDLEKVKEDLEFQTELQKVIEQEIGKKIVSEIEKEKNRKKLLEAIAKNDENKDNITKGTDINLQADLLVNGSYSYYDSNGIMQTIYAPSNEDAKIFWDNFYTKLGSVYTSMEQLSDAYTFAVAAIGGTIVDRFIDGAGQYVVLVVVGSKTYKYGKYVHNIDKLDQNSDEIKHIYNGIKDAPKYPSGFVNVQNGLKKVPINNADVLDALRKIEPGEWNKIYRNGYDANGKKITIHYFEHKNTGKVFDVKTYDKWSTW